MFVTNGIKLDLIPLIFGENDNYYKILIIGTYCSEKLVTSLTKILGLPFTNDHVVVAPSPCAALSEYHDKRALVCCQEDSIDLIPELGFTNYITIPQLVKVFPELDFVDHDKRIELLVNFEWLKFEN